MTTQINPLSVRLAVKSPEIRESLTRIVNGMNGFTVQSEQNAVRVDVLVLEIGSNPEAEFATISALLQEKVVGRLFLTSPKTTPDILLPALRAGAKEFFSQPINPEEVRNAFQKVRQETMLASENGNGQAKEGKIISILGAKGGVGTTTFAVNLATSIQALDPKRLVALIDLNRLVGEVPLFLDLETEANWEEIGKNFSRIDATYLQSAMVKHSSGVYVMPAPSTFDREAHLAPGFLFQLVKAMRRFFDYIVIDSGMVFDDNLFRIFRDSETVYLISILSLPCIINVRKLQESLRVSAGVSGAKLKIVANRFEKKGQISLGEANKIIGTEITTTIPNDYSLAMNAINNGKVFAEISGHSEIAKMYHTLAEDETGLAAHKSGGGFFKWFK